MTGLAGTFGTAATGQVRAPSPAAGSVGIDPMRSDAMALVHRGVLDVQPVDVRLRQAIAQIPLELVEPGDPVSVRQRTKSEERRGGRECVRQWRFRGSPYPLKKQTKKQN